VTALDLMRAAHFLGLRFELDADGSGFSTHGPSASLDRLRDLLANRAADICAILNEHDDPRSAAAVSEAEQIARTRFPNRDNKRLRADGGP